MNTQTAARTFTDMINTDKPVLVDFYTEWCGPCKMMAPVLKELKSRVGDQVTILKVDVDKSPEAAYAYNVQGVPTLILFKNGQVKWRQAGVVSIKILEQVLSQFS